MNKVDDILIVKIKLQDSDKYPWPMNMQERVSSLLEAAFMEELDDGFMDVSITSDSHSGSNIPEDVVKSLIQYMWHKPQAFESLAKKYLSMLTDTELGGLLAEAGEAHEKR